MKICYIGNECLHFKRWIQYFKDSGWNIYIISNKKPDVADISFYNLKVPKIPFLRQIFRIIKIKNFINIIKPDILHIHSAEYAFLASFTKFHPVVITLWGDDINYIPKQSKFSAFAIKKGLEYADLITADAKCLLDGVSKLISINKRKEIIQFGVDIDKFRNGLDTSSLKKELKIESQHKIILSLRHFTMMYYNNDIIINVITEILKKFDKVTFIFIGEGIFREKLKISSKNVRFVGAVNHSMMPLFLNLADMAISIPSIDGTSVSLLESMACEIPVIVSDIPANREWIKNDWNGYLIPPRCEETLVKTISTLLENPEKKSLFGQRSRKIIMEKAVYKTNMEKMKNLYEELVN